MLGNEGMIQRRGASQAATFIVAASDSLHPGRADYVCGGADDQVLIQAAIDACGDGDRVYLDGTFFTSAPITMVDKAITLEGGGHSWSDGGTMIYLENASNCDIIQASVTAGEHAYFPRIKNMYLDGRGAYQTVAGAGIHTVGAGADSVSDATITNVGIAYCKGHGIFLETGWLNSIMNVWSEHNHLDGLRATDGQPKITNSNFSYNDGNGLYLTTNYALVTATTASKNDLNGITCRGAETIINGCRIGNNSYSSAGTYAGILVSLGSRINIVNNLLNGDSTENHNIRIYSAITDALIADNQLWGATVTPINISAGATYQLRNNRGFVTENSGTDTVTAATKAVTHGLAVTPAVGDIMITPVADISPAVRWWISGLTSSQFTINLDQAPTNPADFAWRAIVL